MNDMTDAQISRALALAIGWQESDFYQGGDGSYVAVRCPVLFGTTWKVFDYCDPRIIFPIAERFQCFPSRCGYRWVLWVSEAKQWITADTAAKAVALAVIAARGG